MARYSLSFFILTILIILITSSYCIPRTVTRQPESDRSVTDGNNNSSNVNFVRYALTFVSDLMKNWMSPSQTHAPVSTSKDDVNSTNTNGSRSTIKENYTTENIDNEIHVS